MKLKTDAQGHAVLKDGHPTYVDHAGRDVAFDGPTMLKALHQLAFKQSKFVTEKLSIPPDLASAQFRDRFAFEGGKFVAHDRDGNKIYSRIRPGEVADFDEALEAIVDQYQYKDRILRNAAQGARDKTVGANGKQMSRAEFESIGPADRMAFVRSGGRVV